MGLPGPLVAVRPERPPPLLTGHAVQRKLEWSGHPTHEGDTVNEKLEAASAIADTIDEWNAASHDALLGGDVEEALKLTAPLTELVEVERCMLISDLSRRGELAPWRLAGLARIGLGRVEGRLEAADVVLDRLSGRRPRKPVTVVGRTVDLTRPEWERAVARLS